MGRYSRVAPIGIGLAVAFIWTMGLLLSISEEKVPEPSRTDADFNELEMQHTRLADAVNILTEENQSLKVQLVAREQEIQNLRASIPSLTAFQEEVVGLKAQLERQQQRLAQARANPEGTLEEQRGSERFHIYRVIRETPLLRNPYEGAQVLGRLVEGQQVRIADLVQGIWLKIQHAPPEHPPGYIRRDDARAIGPQAVDS